ncbi:uncharacterized protein LOC134272832 isoform X1 [Saccostrea cucullata]|uniref:uncharacterized protein LOC134272832 isoform X1 n=1 Tax=Saccostrea cuccullata TaxID=36930 RepID=UPI002ED1A5CC
MPPIRARKSQATAKSTMASRRTKGARRQQDRGGRRNLTAVHHADTRAAPETEGIGTSTQGWEENIQASTGMAEEHVPLGTNHTEHHVWIVGSSIVYWACRWAATNLTTNLRLENLGVQVTWIGKRGMKWGDLIDSMEQKLTKCPPPAYLVIHLGGNDITSIKSEVLCTRIEHDICLMTNRLPSCKMIWSDILPRRKWIGGRDICSVERKRKRVNRAARRAVASVNGSVINHPDIEFSEEGLYRAVQL